MLKRDNNKCISCGSTKNLQVHHIYHTTKAKRFVYNTFNGVTLCIICHSDLHPKLKNLILKSNGVRDMNPNLNRKRGKNTERKIAKLMGGTRLGILGNDDIRVKDKFSIEVKNRKRFVGSKWVSQAVRNSPSGMMPIVRLHIHNSKYEDDLIIMRGRDFDILLENYIKKNK